MFDQIIEFVISQGNVSILDLCLIAAIGVLWRALSVREKKHDKDRDEWHKENQEMSKELSATLKKIEDGQERLYLLYNDLARKK